MSFLAIGAFLLFVPHNAEEACVAATTSLLAGSGHVGYCCFPSSAGVDAIFGKPADVAFSPDGGTVAVAEWTGNRIRLISMASKFVSDLAGGAGAASLDGYLDDVGEKARFKLPRGVAYSPDGTTIAVADSGNNCIRLISVATKVVQTLAGECGPDETSAFAFPHGLAYSPDGTMIAVSDSKNHRIRLISVASKSVSTLAGSGLEGYTDDVSTSAQFSWPKSVSYSPDGTMIAVSDSRNHCIRLISVASKSVSTLAGSGREGYTDDVGTSAQFTLPKSVSYSPDGTMIAVADEGNKRVRLIKVATGTVTTLAGSGEEGNANGVGASAQFYLPSGISFSPMSARGTMIAVGSRQNTYPHNQVRLICSGIPPTTAPTPVPTDAPTDAPIAAPTPTPTDAPTAAPTDAPTDTDVPTDVDTTGELLLDLVTVDGTERRIVSSSDYAVVIQSALNRGYREASTGKMRQLSSESSGQSSSDSSERSSSSGNGGTLFFADLLRGRQLGRQLAAPTATPTKAPTAAHELVVLRVEYVRVVLEDGSAFPASANELVLNVTTAATTATAVRYHRRLVSDTPQLKAVLNVQLQAEKGVQLNQQFSRATCTVTQRSLAVIVYDRQDADMAMDQTDPPLGANGSESNVGVVVACTIGLLLALIAPFLVASARRWHAQHLFRTQLHAITTRQGQVSFSEMQIRLAHIKVGRLIGRGGQGSVYEGSFGGMAVAVKQYHKSCHKSSRGDMDTNPGTKSADNKQNGRFPFSDNGFFAKGGTEESTNITTDARGGDVTVETIDPHLRREIEVLAQLRHVHVILFYGHARALDGELFLVFELAATTLAASLPAIAEANDVAALRLVAASQIAHAMWFLHYKHIIHRDLCADNVLSMHHHPHSSNLHLKLADFGLSRVVTSVKKQARMTLGIVRQGCTAPELVGNSARSTAGGSAGGSAGVGCYTSAVDVYAYAHLLCILWDPTGSTIDPALEGKSAAQVAKEAYIDGYRPRIDSSCLAAVADLIQRGWGAKPSARPSFEHICAVLGGLCARTKGAERGGGEAPGTGVDMAGSEDSAAVVAGVSGATFYRNPMLHGGERQGLEQQGLPIESVELATRVEANVDMVGTAALPAVPADEGDGLEESADALDWGGDQEKRKAAITIARTSLREGRKTAIARKTAITLT
jgi:DNA-binding beta-propeller fold protein YncE/serine/threonine protein kinase